MNYQEARDYIEETNQYGSVLGLATIIELCRRLKNPQNDLKFVHIAGTNGKGSTLAYLSTILKEAGYRVGRYLSPTVFSYEEKMQVNERPISKKKLSQLMGCVKQACEEMVADGFSHPTTFEIETALSFLFFIDQKCDIVVLETGLGGTLDATNLIETTVLSVITPISMDHMWILGKTIAEIAEKKAGIMKHRCPVVSAKQPQEAMDVIVRGARERECTLTIANTERASKIVYGFPTQSYEYHSTHENYKKVTISLAGTFQIENSILAIEAAEALNENGFPITKEQILSGLSKTSWFGRLSKVSDRPLFLIDGAHNEAAARELRNSIEHYFTNRKIIYIMGVLSDKEYDKIIDLTASLASHIITVTTPNNSRALPAYELAQAVKRVNKNVTCADSLQEAVEMSFLLAEKQDLIIAFGSLSYLGEITTIVTNRNQMRSDSHGRQK